MCVQGEHRVHEHEASGVYDKACIICNGAHPRLSRSLLPLCHATVRKVGKEGVVAARRTA